MNKKSLTLDHYKDRDLFYLYEIVFLWFDEIPDIECLNNSPKQSVLDLSDEILHVLKPLNEESDFIIQLSSLYVQKLNELRPVGLGIMHGHFYDDWLPSVGDWLPFDQSQHQFPQDIETVTIKKAQSWQKYLFTRDELKGLAKQREQEPPILFPDARNDFKKWRALKNAYNSNEDQQKKKKDKPNIKPQVTFKVKERRLHSLRDFVVYVRRARGETGLLKEPYYFPCKIETIYEALKDWEMNRVKRKCINKNEKLWDIKCSSFEKGFWENNSERKEICEGIKPGHKSNDVFFKKN